MQTSHILAFLASLAVLVSASNPCSNDNQCVSGLCFENKVCSDCYQDADCKSNGACYLIAGDPTGRGVCRPSDANIVECRIDDGCPLGSICLPNGVCSSAVTPFQIQFGPSGADPRNCIDYTIPSSLQLLPCVLNSPTQLLTSVTTPTGTLLKAAASDMYLTNYGDWFIDFLVMSAVPNAQVTFENNRIQMNSKGECLVGTTGGSISLYFVFCRAPDPLDIQFEETRFQVYTPTPPSTTSSSTTRAAVSTSTTRPSPAETNTSSDSASVANSPATATTRPTSTVGSISPKPSEAPESLSPSASFTTSSDMDSLNPSDSVDVPGAGGGVATATATLAYGYLAPGSVPTTVAVQTGRNLYASGGDVVGVAMGLFGWVAVLAL
ncbi:hypothetical protein HDU98_001328 [Podochytrium sp. JEL0797]|nr:hypothetical protein HDU98_001328 [Podochytrium sp. JEL0797]